jgi:hypothetical protein
MPVIVAVGAISADRDSGENIGSCAPPTADVTVASDIWECAGSAVPYRVRSARER